MENNPHKKFREIDSFDFLVNCEKNEQKKIKNREIKILPFADAEVIGGIGRSLVSLKALAKGL